ncbi:MAG: hypothetical protein R3176_06395 [Woeseiaceae bacterium]|nr:hypothetical protein [Woeseiaceae bacterium]
MARINGLLTLAFIGACIWFAATLGFGGGASGAAAEFAEAACVDAISDRYGAQAVKPYAVDRNPSGFVVRASITVRGKQPAKVYCLANDHGGVEELRVVEW